ncbi:MAG: 30S ribosomal protein S20 [Clostridia bacterium]|nr:30S ribosomal protein S20 [Clostridia bacterium]
MPIIKSQKKRVLVTKDENARNNSRKTEVKNVIKKFEAAVANGDVESAKELLNKAFSVIDAAEVDGIYHKNNAARKKSRLASKLYQLQQSK